MEITIVLASAAETNALKGEFKMERKLSEEVIFRFEIKSLDSARPTIDAVPDIENLSAELLAILAARYPGTGVKIRRAEGIPGLRELQELLLYVDWHAVKTGAETAIGAFAASEFLKLIKSKIRNVHVKQVQQAAKPAIAAEASRPDRSVQGTKPSHTETSRPPKKPRTSLKRGKRN